MKIVDLISTIKIKKLSLSKNLQVRINKSFEEKKSIKNVLTIYKLTKVFNLPTLAQETLHCVESCFTILVETQNFLQLDYTLAAKILHSSDLHITSELEVFNSANLWLNYNFGERKKYAKDLLKTVRLSLLSDHSLKYILKESSSFAKIEDCVTVLKKILKNKENLIETNSSLFCTHRYCRHNKFNLIVCGGRNKTGSCLKALSDVNQIDVSNFKTTKALPSMIGGRTCSKAICLKGEVYVFGGYGEDKKLDMSVERYSILTKTWKKVGHMYDNRDGYCFCAFMDSFFIFGGSYSNSNYTDSCLQFHTKDCNWKQVARMNEVKTFAACTVFEGRIVVSGGQNGYGLIKTVESYDVVGGRQWLPMPNMINGRRLHKLVVVRNKLFVIGSHRTGCEVFDNKIKKFVVLKPPDFNIQNLNKLIPIGNNFFDVYDGGKMVLCYDVDKNKWSRKYLKYNLVRLSCVKIPWY